MPALLDRRRQILRAHPRRCQSTKGIAYRHVAGQLPAVKAETCDECRTYTKIVHKDRLHLLLPANTRISVT
jgi:FdhE protein